MRKIIILGSTGSIGTQTLSIIKEFGDIEVLGLACGYNIPLLITQIETFKPKYVATASRQEKLEKTYPEITFYYGEEGLKEMASLPIEADFLNALVGSIGLIPTLEAIKSHKKVFLSNKETLVIGGPIVKEYLNTYKESLYPIDSEHTSLWELLDAYGKENVDFLTITASGGPFRDLSLAELNNVTLEETLNHPNWKMGKKITVDSATMMNKAFELIEAHYLFDYPMDKINAVINRSSTCHAMVTLKDGTVHYATGKPSMRNPIIRALYYPEIRYVNEEVDKASLYFEPIKEERYPAMYLAYRAMEEGGLMPTVMNAANESAVALYLKGEISFTMIFEIVKEAMNKWPSKLTLTVSNIMKYDKIVKNWVLETYKKEK